MHVKALDNHILLAYTHVENNKKLSRQMCWTSWMVLHGNTCKAIGEYMFACLFRQLCTQPVLQSYWITYSSLNTYFCFCIHYSLFLECHFPLILCGCIEFFLILRDQIVAPFVKPSFCDFLPYRKNGQCPPYTIWKWLFCRIHGISN